MSRAMSPPTGTGVGGGAAGVKTGKLYVEQAQIGNEVRSAPLGVSGRVLEPMSNHRPR